MFNAVSGVDAVHRAILQQEADDAIDLAPQEAIGAAEPDREIPGQLRMALVSVDDAYRPVGMVEIVRAGAHRADRGRLQLTAPDRIQHLILETERGCPHAHAAEVGLGNRSHEDCNHLMPGRQILEAIDAAQPGGKGQGDTAALVRHRSTQLKLFQGFRIVDNIHHHVAIDPPILGALGHPGDIEGHAELIRDRLGELELYPPARVLARCEGQGVGRNSLRTISRRPHRSRGLSGGARPIESRPDERQEREDPHAFLPSDTIVHGSISSARRTKRGG